MKRLIAILFVIGMSLCAQTTAATGTATLHVGPQNITFSLPTYTLTVSCLRPDGTIPNAGEQIVLNINQSSTCTAKIDQPAPVGGYKIAPFSIDYPTNIPITASTSALLIPAGSSAVTFTISRGAQ